MNMRRLPRMRTLALSTLAAGAVFAAGCQNDAQSGSLIGAGIGALAGQAIGHDTEGTLIGAGVGAGAGYIIGNESDKAKEREYRYRNPNYNY
ncbi:MAG: glycine zipper 2TM domain-containing protein [Phycisphaerales bacterium]|nr:glycine zipper 2TM domain-containing protein [Phycisphaerales bacterium]